MIDDTRMPLRALNAWRVAALQGERRTFLVLSSNFRGFPETAVARASIADIASKQLA